LPSSQQCKKHQEKQAEKPDKKNRQFNLFDMKAWSSLPKFTIMPKTPEKIQESCFFQGSQQCRKRKHRKKQTSSKTQKRNTRKASCFFFQRTSQQCHQII
jgi:hypothetical protein